MSTVIHLRISDELDEFIEAMTEKPEFHNKAHVVVFALEQLKRRGEENGTRCAECPDRDVCQVV